jgi:hypothetical protein
MYFYSHTTRLCRLDLACLRNQFEGTVCWGLNYPIVVYPMRFWVGVKSWNCKRIS